MCQRGRLNPISKRCTRCSSTRVRRSPSFQTRPQPLRCSPTCPCRSSTRYTTGRSRCLTSLRRRMLPWDSRQSHTRRSGYPAYAATPWLTTLTATSHTTIRSLLSHVACRSRRVTSLVLVIGLARARYSLPRTGARWRTRTWDSTIGTSFRLSVRMVRAVSTSI